MSKMTREGRDNGKNMFVATAWAFYMVVALGVVSTLFRGLSGSPAKVGWEGVLGHTCLAGLMLVALYYPFFPYLNWVASRDYRFLQRKL